MLNKESLLVLPLSGDFQIELIFIFKQATWAPSGDFQNQKKKTLKKAFSLLGRFTLLARTLDWIHLRG